MGILWVPWPKSIFPDENPRSQNYRKPTPAEREKKAAAFAVAKAKCDAFVGELFANKTEYETNVQAIAEKHGHRPEKAFEILSTSNHFQLNMRGVSSQNALMHYLSKEENGSLQRGEKMKPDELRQKLDHDLKDPESDLYKIAHDDDRMALLKEEVMTNREQKARGARVSSNSTAQDIRHTVDTVAKEFHHLNQCTGALGFFFITPGNRDCKGTPAWGIAGRDTFAFFKKELGYEPWDILADFQMFGAKGTKRKGQESGPEIQSQCANWILKGLHKLVLFVSIVLSTYLYTSTGKYKVRLLWPSNCNNGVVANPSKLNVDDLRILHRELEVGTCRWVEVDGKELGRKTQPNINPPATTTTTNAPPSKKRKQQSDKGVTRGPRKRPRTSENDPSPSTSHTQQKRKKQAPKSAEIVDNAADDDIE
ncbi:hypothetical protein K435DRAFT_853480 [Dendrothele bispora CBS 962.96]|uniref:Uncharacterized protein n=1 Tax=Dendrothele bispora (strain CBS 962.96) TaxID=1314807 RepID=A0A4S8MGI6_DENBC|nr:hypothetical protein K435DRAFT_853480 [Dendrothele bispora CBS 962.96]